MATNKNNILQGLNYVRSLVATPIENSLLYNYKRVLKIEIDRYS